jgi:hypothetical protein
LGVRVNPETRVLGLGIPSSDEKRCESRICEFAHFQTFEEEVYIQREVRVGLDGVLKLSLRLG